MHSEQHDRIPLAFLVADSPICESCPSSVGIGPMTELSAKLNTRKSLSSPNSDGNRPRSAFPSTCNTPRKGEGGGREAGGGGQWRER